MRSRSQPESRRRLELFGEGEGGGKDSGFVFSRRSLIRDADREFHVVRVRAHADAKEEPLIQLFLNLLDFDLCHHHSPLCMSRSLRRRGSITRVAKLSSEPRAFSTLGFPIVEIDFARIGAVSGTVVIDGGPAR